MMSATSDVSTCRKDDVPEDLCDQAVKLARMVQSLPESRIYAIILYKHHRQWFYGVISGGKVQTVGPRSSME
jgi:hypothetical protein